MTENLAQDFEKLGLFYLGRRFDLGGAKSTPDLVLYDSRDLLTHAVCIGMTGSGKTGLCLSLVEEAAITDSRNCHRSKGRSFKFVADVSTSFSRRVSALGQS